MSASKVFVLGMSHCALCLGFSAVLVACGGGSDAGGNRLVGAKSDTVAKGNSTVGSTPAPSELPSQTQTDEILRKGAELNQVELAAAQAALGASGSKASQFTTKAFSGLITAYRFYNSQTGAHFYTVNTTERDNIIANLRQFQYEGPAFLASAVAAQGLSQVHRFYNTQTGVHFYTISISEKNLIQQTLPQYQYEGVAYYASKVTGTALTPLHRFYVNTRGFHFYSNNQAETDAIRNNPATAHYVYEGVGYYVLGGSYEARPVVLPHSGVSTSSCYPLGSSTVVVCDSDSGRSLYQAQDGHRASINPMSYSEVPAAAGGTYPRTECVKDNMTGLFWEGKNAVEPRSGAAVVTYANVAAYVTYVNSIALCGFTNWRVPEIQELHSIVDYGRRGPSQDTEWFPNAASNYYWSSTQSVVSSAAQNWVVDFDDGRQYRYARTSSLRVRLVRHQP